MSQYFWSHAKPHSKTQNKGWDAALMSKLEKSTFLYRWRYWTFYLAGTDSYHRPLSKHKYAGVISLIFSQECKQFSSRIKCGNFSVCSSCYTPDIYAEGYIVFVFPFICSYVSSFVCSFICSFVRSFVLPSHSWNYFKVLHASNLSGVYLTNYSSESIHIWTIGTLEGRLSFCDSSPQGPCPGVGLEVKI